MSEKKGFNFNIIKNDPLDGHKGTNIGSISLDNIAPVFIDVENQKAFVDIGGMTTERSEQGPYYAGVTACYLLVNKSIRRGYKSMPEHVNMMDKSMKHQFIIDQIGDDNKQILKKFLQNHNVEMWNNSSEELYRAFE